MTTRSSDTAQRLLAAVHASHETLIAHADAGGAARQGLAAAHAALCAGVSGLGEDDLLATPSPEEWSMAEVLEHVAEHDRKYDELLRIGIDHYVEHGLEHALQLWRLRPPSAPPGGAVGARDGGSPMA